MKYNGAYNFNIFITFCVYNLTTNYLGREKKNRRAATLNNISDE